MREVNWSVWRTLTGAAALSADTLRELVDGGQSFRWHADEAGVWTGVWGEHVARLRLHGGSLEFQTPRERTPRGSEWLHQYLGFGPEQSAILDALPWRSDPHLAQCVAEFPGLRILRQPFAETLLCFLCSATKQIVQIKQIVARLAERFGSPLAPGFHRLPRWDELAAVSEKDLRGCLLGFRARYIHQTALFLQAHPEWLRAVESLPYAEAKAQLCELPGVGEKVADCALLFGAARFEAFPVDVWILKTMARRYGLEGWRPAQLAQFGRVHFGPGAGLAQQFLFAWERREARAQRSPR